ncbi:MAG TPA: 2-oxo acid dehydrogenase subunit E2 [Solirubrobacteraceae bacterium]|nr:2-oxo acid dehydrogenase subunit E2 [Solirubrobacteraceae bacterium]
MSPPQRDAAGAALKGQTRVVEPDRGERAIGRRSAETRATVPDLELSVDVDAGRLLQSVERDRVSTTAVLVAACAAALRACPRANGAYRDGHFELYSRVNVAVTLPGPSSQVAATVLDADARSPAELEGELTRLRGRARTGELTPPEQAGATFTLADLGEYGIHRAAALITPPQAAALTAGAVRAVPVVRDGAVTAGRLLTLTLVSDHRILFGAEAAGFLAAVAGHLERGA